VQMNASLSKSTLKFLVYRASVAAPEPTTEPTPEPTLSPLRDHPLFFAVSETLFCLKVLPDSIRLEIPCYSRPLPKKPLASNKQPSIHLITSFCADDSRIAIERIKKKL
jgi:hypothetical protein